MSNTLIIGIVCGIIGGVGARYFNMPGGAFLGAMIGCGVYSASITGGVPLSTNTRLVIQIATGIMIGATIKREMFQGDPSFFLWGVAGAFVFLMVGLALAYIASSLGYIDLATAFFGFAPGGLTGMAVMAQEEGADAPKVVLMHFMRVVALFIIVPILVRWLLR